MGLRQQVEGGACAGRSPRLLAWNQLRQDFAQLCRWASPDLSPGLRPASSQVHLKETRAPTDSMPAGGSPGTAPGHCRLVGLLVLRLLTTVLAGFQSAGQGWAGQPAPPGSCSQSSSVPRPGDWRPLTPIAASHGQVSPWSLPLLCPRGPGLGFHGGLCLSQGLLAPCWLRGQARPWLWVCL